jgi:hypothetical protein
LDDLHQLHQDAGGALRVKKRHPVTTGTRAGGLVNELVSLPAEAIQGGSQVRYAVGDVVESRSATGQKASHGALRIQGLEELEGPDERDPDPLSGKLLHRGTPEAQEAFEEGYRLVQ